MEMKLILELNGETYPVTVSADATTYTVSLPDRQYTIDVRRIEETDTLSLLVGTESVDAWTSRTDRGYEVSVLGETFEVEVEDALRAGLKSLSRGGGANAEEIVRAPMPGVVVEVKAVVGSEIEAGDTAVVVEAMKMRNEFGPKRGGTVVSVAVEAGQSVERGQELCVIKPPEEPDGEG